MVDVNCRANYGEAGTALGTLEQTSLLATLVHSWTAGWNYLGLGELQVNMFVLLSLYLVCEATFDLEKS